MNIENYKDAVADPKTHLEFLRHVEGMMEGINCEGQDAARKLYAKMRDDIAVGNGPFSQARHLLALENASGNWDLEEASPDVLQQILVISQRIQEFDPGYKVCDFTVGFDWMKELAGDNDFSPHE